MLLLLLLLFDGSVADEDEFVVVVPTVLFRVHAGLHVGAGRGRARAAAGHARETGLLQRVETLPKRQTNKKTNKINQ